MQSVMGLLPETKYFTLMGLRTGDFPVLDLGVARIAYGYEVGFVVSSSIPNGRDVVNMIAAVFVSTCLTLEVVTLLNILPNFLPVFPVFSATTALPLIVVFALAVHFLGGYSKFIAPSINLVSANAKNFSCVLNAYFFIMYVFVEKLFDCCAMFILNISNVKQISIRAFAFIAQARIRTSIYSLLFLAFGFSAVWARQLRAPAIFGAIPRVVGFAVKIISATFALTLTLWHKKASCWHDDRHLSRVQNRQQKAMQTISNYVRSVNNSYTLDKVNYSTLEAI